MAAAARMTWSHDGRRGRRRPIHGSRPSMSRTAEPHKVPVALAATLAPSLLPSYLDMVWHQSAALLRAAPCRLTAGHIRNQGTIYKHRGVFNCDVVTAGRGCVLQPPKKQPPVKLGHPVATEPNWAWSTGPRHSSL
eukprot:275318-Chlamydomonas_euryale.AAC.2